MAGKYSGRNLADRQSQIAYHESEVERERALWDRYRREGTTDQWPDGVGLNLTRNHIIYHLMQIAAIRADDNPFQLSIWDAPDKEDPFRAVDRCRVMSDSRIPPEVKSNFMVRPRAGVLYARPEELVYEP